ncbi:MAG TPA: heavy-metal-associated domain-containing protein [Acidimicrobiales bacterium]|nr:heavy-metal-associated domain-containing protein [Acidimicrobiales bacterium]
MTTTTFTIGAIHCASCENTIRTALSRVDGVALVVPSAARNEVRISFDETAVTVDELRARLGDLGFEAVS